MKTETTRLLSYLNAALPEMIATLRPGGKEPVGEKTAASIVAQRTKLGEGGFTDFTQVAAIRELGKQKANALLILFIQEVKHKDKVRSRTTFSFAGAPPVLPEYGKEVIFEKLSSGLGDDNNISEYEVFYGPGVNRDQLFKTLRNQRMYHGESLSASFALQARNNQFVLATSDFDEVLLYNLYHASTFRAVDVQFNPYNNNPACPVTWPTQLTNPNHKFKTRLQFLSYNNSRVVYFDNSLVLSSRPLGSPQADEFFDIEGVFGGEPWPGAQNYLHSVTIMNHQNSPCIRNQDNRYYIGANHPVPTGPGVLSNCFNKNHNPSWDHDNQFRFVEVVENVGIRSFNNPSHGNNEYFLSVQNYLSVNAKAYPLNTNPAALSDRERFDMYVFYGVWDDRGNKCCRVAFRSHYSGCFLGLKDSPDNVTEELSCEHYKLNDRTSFYVNNGWGTDPDNIFLQTSYGKFLGMWGTWAGSASENKLSTEQLRIVIP
jgi:hypothetical protein